MRRLLIVLALTTACTSGTDAPDVTTGWRAGAASRSVLPTVGGSHAYADPGVMPLDIDATSPGLFVDTFDQGPIQVGNGNPDAHWVRDDLRVRTLALQRAGDPRIVVVVTTDLYMMFAPDVMELRLRVHAALPDVVRDHVLVLVAATHNHHGPDTAFHVNPAWYDLMLDQTRDAVRDAVDRLEPATLRAAEGTHYFGASDLSGIRVYDPTLGVLQARAPDGRVIATLVQWANHPESTLNWSPPRAHIAEHCVTLGWSGAQCDARGRYFTADFPGALARTLGPRLGGEVLYVNGAIGAMASPLGVPVWEVDERAPVGNGYTPPDLARPPGGEGTDFAVRNFRKAFLIGDQLGRAAEALLSDATPLAPTRFDARTEPFVTRMSNIGFRKLAVVDTATGRARLGFMPGPLYTCADGPSPSREACTDDGKATEEDPVVGVIRRGTHTESAVTLLEVGDLSLLFLPGEVPGELVIGLPAEVKTHPERWQDEAPARHVSPAALEIPGYVKRLMPGRLRWVAGLGNDELGYILPLANYRVKCVADQIVEPGACAKLQAAGVIEFVDGVAGSTCKAIADRGSGNADRGSGNAADRGSGIADREAGHADRGAGHADRGARIGGRAAVETGPGGAPHEAVVASCRYGQVLGQAAGHYEETNSVGWDAAQDMFDAVARLTGSRDTTQVNPEFAGHWHQHPGQ